MKSVLVFQPAALEHAGRFASLFEQTGMRLHIVKLDEGGAIPNLDWFDAQVVLGGAQQVWQENRCPWLIAEKVAIRRAVCDLDLPYFGICLGHQLLADALGGKVGSAASAKNGFFRSS